MDIAKRYYRRNAFLIFIDPALFMNGMTFLSITAVIPYFLIKLGASNTQISIANVLVSLGTLIPQLFIAKVVQGMRYKSVNFTWVLLAQRFIFAAYVFTIPFFAVKNPRLSIVMFLIFWGVFSFFVGTYSPFYFSIMTKVIPYDKRGSLLGNSYAFGSITALMSSYLLNVLLNKLRFPLNYTAVFGLGVFILIVDALLFAIIKEPPDEQVTKGGSIKDFFKEIPVILKENGHFRNSVIAYVFIVIANVSLSYYAVYATRAFHASPSDIAAFTAISLGANVVSNILLGQLSSKKGHRAVLMVSTVLGICASISVLLIRSLIGIFVAFTLSTVLSSGYALSSGILISKYVEQGSISTYVAINNTITMFFSTLMFMLSGRLIDAFGFTSVFLVSLVAAVAAFLQLRYKVVDD
ncbi:MFS transporter [Caldanaerobius polysaccharolyticus]|uniref:MFS transporter n=1 Tax=Caldanaerobius polysaccharolyticus TaxID=44256 RepID=UPI00047A422C|nr:MFS transporter [Caldanaerobius polysaccharolyticus]